MFVVQLRNEKKLCNIFTIVVLLLVRVERVAMQEIGDNTMRLVLNL